MEELVDLSFQLSDFVCLVNHAEDSSHHFVQDGLKKDNLRICHLNFLILYS